MSESNKGQNQLDFDLRTCIAAVQAQHHHWDYAGALTCACGETFGLGVEAGWEAAVAGWAVHVADVVIRVLEESVNECWEYWPARRCVVLGTVEVDNA